MKYHKPVTAFVLGIATLWSGELLAQQATLVELAPYIAGSLRSPIGVPLDAADETEKQTIGRAYDSLFGEVKPVSCVELLPHTPPLGDPAPAPTVTQNILQITDVSSLVTATQITAATAFNWAGGKSDAAASYMFSNRVSTYRSFALQQTDVTYPLQSYGIEKFRLNSLGRRLLSKGYEIFRFSCGDSFILGYNRGGKFSAAVSMDATTIEEQQQINSSISASVTSGSMTAAYKDYLEKKSATGQLQIDVVRDALEENLPKLDIASLVAYSQEYPTKIRDAKVKPIKSIQTGDYLTVILASGHTDPHGSIPAWGQRLANQFRYLLSLTKYRSDLAYIRDHRDQFIPYDPQPISVKITSASTLIDRISAWAVECVRTAGNDCPDQTSYNIPVPGYSPERALVWIVPQPAVQQRQLIGTSTSNMVLQAKGTWQFGNDPRALLPVTGSTEVYLVYNANPADVRQSPTVTIMDVPAGFAVYFRFIDIPDSYGDNHVYGPDPASARLGGAIAAFVNGM